MALLSVTPTRRRRNDMTILDENLNQTQFDTTETVLSMTPVEDQESTRKFLELSGAKELDRQFNDTVKQYETQFKLQSVALQQQSNIAEQDALMQAGETLGQLGTGAAAAASQDISKANAEASQAAQQKLTEQFTTAISGLQEVYSEQLTETLGELTTEGFSKIVEHDKMVEGFSEVVLEQVAANVGIEFTDMIDLQLKLVEQGLAADTDVPGEIELTEIGMQQFKAVLMNTGEEFGGEYSQRLDNLVENWAEKYITENYPDLDPESTSYDKKMSEIKQEYNQWMQENMPAAYYTHLNMARLSDSGTLLFEGTDYTNEVPPENIGASTGYTYAESLDAEWFGEFAGSGRENSNQSKYLNGIISDIKEGIVPDGSYFVANYGASADSSNKQYFYYENGRVYKTEFSFENPPTEFSADAMYKVEQSKGLGGIGNDLFGTGGWTYIDSAQKGKLKSGEYKIGSSKYLYDADTKKFTQVR